FDSRNDFRGRRKRPPGSGIGSHRKRHRRRSRPPTQGRGCIGRTAHAVFDRGIYRNHFHRDGHPDFHTSGLHQIKLMTLRNIHSSRTGSAFTLIELLLVLVILGILAALVVPKFSGRTEQARNTAAQSQIATFGTALDAFEVDNGYYPKGKNGLQDLVNQPRDAQNWKGPYMKNAIPNDPWGHPYVYECPG